MRLSVGVENDSRVQKVAGVEYPLDLFHQLECLGAPLQFDERSHVSSRPVLGFERAIVFPHDQRRHVIDEAAVSFDLSRRSEILLEYKVQVSLERMTENNGIVVPVLLEECPQIKGRLGQQRDGKGHILDDDRRAGRTHRSNRGEQTLANIPESSVLRDVFGECDRADRWRCCSMLR